MTQVIDKLSDAKEDGLYKHENPDVAIAVRVSTVDTPSVVVYSEDGDIIGLLHYDGTCYQVTRPEPEEPYHQVSSLRDALVLILLKAANKPRRLTPDTSFYDGWDDALSR